MQPKMRRYNFEMREMPGDALSFMKFTRKSPIVTPSKVLEPTLSSKNKTRTDPLEMTRRKERNFLGQFKAEAKNIARNPTRFLDDFADGKFDFLPLTKKNDPLNTMLESISLESKTKFEKKVEKFKTKTVDSKKRAFILNVNSSPAAQNISANPIDDLLSEQCIHKSSGEVLDDIIAHYLEEIKLVDVGDIESWISTNSSGNCESRLKLPYGFPANLKMPTDPHSVEDKVLADFVETAADEFLILDGEYNKKLEEINRKLSDNFVSIQSTKWSIKDVALLYYVASTLDANTLSATTLQNDLTGRLFPSRSREEIIAQKYRLKMKRFWEERRDNIIRDWIRDKEDLQEKMDSAWDELHKKRVMKLEWEAKSKKQLELCMYWATVVEKMRKEKCAKIKRLEVIVEPFEKRLEEQERFKRLQEIRRREELKLEVNKYRHYKTQAIHERKKSDTLIQEMKQFQDKLQDSYNRDRVNYRKYRFEEKQQTRKELEALKEYEELKKVELLEKTKEKIEIDYKPENALQETFASLIRRNDIRESKDSEEEAIIKFFRERYSFSSDHVWADRRVRVEAKLRAAGLIESSYARQVLMAMQSKPKPHLYSSIDFHDQ